MSNDLAIPDYLKDMMASTAAPQTNDMVSGGVTTPRISLKGKIFRFKEGGEELEKIKENLDVVIVGVMPEHGTAKTFYEGEYNPDSSDPPDCSSTDGVQPDTWVTNPINNLCATCANNKFGSAISMAGKKSKACRDSRRLYVVKASEMKNEEPKVWLLNVTVSSLKPLNNYSKELAKQGISTPSVVITRLNFDDDADYPMLVFDALGCLNQEMATVSLAIAEEKEWDMPTSAPKAIASDKQAMPAIESKPEVAAEVVNEAVANVQSETSTKREAGDDVDNILETWD